MNGARKVERFTRTAPTLVHERKVDLPVVPAHRVEIGVVVEVVDVLALARPLAGEQLALVEAAVALSAEPEALQLRYMQTLADIANDRTTTIVFPLPMDLLSPFVKPRKD